MPNTYNLFIKLASYLVSIAQYFIMPNDLENLLFSTTIILEGPKV